MTRRLLPAIFLACVAAAQDNSVWIDLSGPWKFSSKDDPAFAQPSIDDSSWTTVRLPSNPGLFSKAPAWLRRSVELPAGAGRADLTVTLGTLQDVYQVFVNGVQIGGSGDFDDFSRVSVPRPRSFRIPSDVASKGAPRPITIAIRAKQALRLPPQYRLRDQGPYLLTTTNQTPWHEGEWALDRKWREFSLYWLQCGLYLAIALTCLMGWWAEKRRTELIWFAAFALAHAALLYFLVAIVHPDIQFPHRGTFTDPMSILIGLVYLMFAQFTLTALRVRSKWPSILLWAGFVAAQPVYFLPFLWALGFASAMVIWNLRRDWGSIATEERVFRSLLLACGLDTAVHWVIIFRTGDAPGLFRIGEYSVGRSNFDWLLLAFAVFVLLFRRGARERRERERLDAELAAAAAIQRLLLSQPALTDQSLSLEARYVPAHEVGGDFYLVIGGEVLLAGDVSGKGLKAAMVVSLVAGALRERDERSPAALLGILNRALYGQTEGGFVTCCAIRFEPDGRLQVANAGHLPPYLDGHPVAASGSLPLGIAAATEYEQTTAQLGAGSQLALVSDGVVEAANAKGELFGFDRTAAIVTKSAREIADAARAWGQNDDITVVTVRRAAA